jgi:hypothetical protein
MQKPLASGDQCDIFSMVPNVYGTSVCNLLPVTLLTPRILRLLLEFWTTFVLPDLIEKIGKNLIRIKQA